MHIIRIMVPFLQGQPVAGRDIAEYLFRTVRNPVIKYFSPVLYDQDQVIVRRKTECALWSYLSMISAFPPFRLKEISSVDTSITQLRLSNKRSVPLIYTFFRYRKAEKQKKRKRR